MLLIIDSAQPGAASSSNGLWPLESCPLPGSHARSLTSGDGGLSDIHVFASRTMDSPLEHDSWDRASSRSLVSSWLAISGLKGYCPMNVAHSEAPCRTMGTWCTLWLCH